MDTATWSRVSIPDAGVEDSSSLRPDFDLFFESRVFWRITADETDSNVDTVASAAVERADHAWVKLNQFPAGPRDLVRLPGLWPDLRLAPELAC